MPYRVDAVTLRGDAYETEEGYIKGLAAVTRTGVFAYRDSEGNIRRELRHPDDVFKNESLTSLHNIPITDGHPQSIVNVDNARELSVGHVGENVTVDAPLVLAPLTVNTRDGVQAIQNGRDKFSCGYYVDLIEQVGTYDGEEYDYRQVNIKYNHLALTASPRLGAELSLNMDSEDAIQIEKSEIPHTNKPESRGDSIMPPVTRTINIDSIPYEVPPEVAVAYEKARARADSAEEKLQGMKSVELDSGEHLAAEPVVKALDEARANADSAKEEIEKLREMDRTDEVNKLVRERTDLVSRADSILDSDTLTKLDSMSNDELREAIIVAHADESSREELAKRLDSESADYVRARYDAIADSIPRRDSSAVERFREFNSPGAPKKNGSRNDAGGGDLPDLNQKREDMKRGGKRETAEKGE